MQNDGKFAADMQIAGLIRGSLDMPMLKNSKQRNAILKELESRCDHPTAEQIYLDVKRTFPSLSLATVYRNLRILEEEGCIVKISGENAEHFDGNKMKHYHLTCRKCGKIVDLEISNNSAIDSLPQNFDGIIEGHSLMFHGLCPECATLDGKNL